MDHGSVIPPVFFYYLEEAPCGQERRLKSDQRRYLIEFSVVTCAGKYEPLSDRPPRSLCCRREGGNPLTQSLGQLAHHLSGYLAHMYKAVECAQMHSCNTAGAKLPPYHADAAAAKTPLTSSPFVLPAALPHPPPALPAFLLSCRPPATCLGFSAG